MNSHLIRLLSLVGIVLLALVAVSVPTATWAAELPTIEVGLPGGGMFGLGGRYVLDKGLDRKNGFIYKPRWAGVSAVERLMAIGAIPMGLGTSESAVRANLKGNKLRLIQPYMTPHQHLLVRKDSPYKNVMDLKGKPLATTPAVSSMYNMFDFIMKKRKVNIEKDFQLKKLGAAGIRAVLEKGDVEGALIWEAHVSKLLATGKYRVLMVLRDEMAKLLNTKVKMMAWVGATESWVKQNPVMVSKVRAAWQEAINDMRNDEAHFRKYAKKMFGLEKPNEVALGWKRARTFLLPLNFKWPDRANLDAEKKYLLGGMEMGMFPKETVDVIDKMFVP
jgi:ABC-type nitrate/sulfonate/bicarbonate transport system substrate-binding protein